MTINLHSWYFKDPASLFSTEITDEMLKAVFHELELAAERVDIADEAAAPGHYGAQLHWHRISQFANALGSSRQYEVFQKVAMDIYEAARVTDADRREAAGDDKYHADVERGE